MKEDYSRDTCIGVDLLEDLVDVRGVRLDPLLASLLAALSLRCVGLCGLGEKSARSEGRMKRHHIPWQEPWTRRREPWRPEKREPCWRWWILWEAEEPVNEKAKMAKSGVLTILSG